MKPQLNIFFIIIMLSMLSFSYVTNESGNDTTYENTVTSEIFCNDTIPNSIYTGWGYNIYRNKKLFIHQPHIPAISGNKGFVSITDAEKIAKLVITKIQKNIIPPDITLHELDSLKIKIP